MKFIQAVKAMAFHTRIDAAGGETYRRLDAAAIELEKKLEKDETIV